MSAFEPPQREPPRLQVKRPSCKKISMIQGVVQDLNPEFDNIAYKRVSLGIPDIFDKPQITYENFFTGCEAISLGEMSIPHSVGYEDPPGPEVIFQADKVIGSGTFGTIVQYTHDRKLKIGVKITGKNEPCFDTKELFPENNTEEGHKYILRQFCIDTKYNNLNIVAMELCNGTLKDLMLQHLNFGMDGTSIYNMYGMWPQCIRIDILIKTIQAVAYLWKLGYAYTDMKLENVLYKMVPGVNKYEIVPKLGDLDGLCDSREDSLVNAHSTVTYPSPEYNRSVCTEADVSWGIGFLLVMMLTAAQQGGAKKLETLQLRHHHSSVFLPGGVPDVKKLGTETAKTQKLIDNVLLPGLGAEQIGIVNRLFNPKESRTKVDVVLGVMNSYRTWLDTACPQQIEQKKLINKI